MHDRRHTLIPSLNPDDIESAKHHLGFGIDGALEALLVLSPDTTTWAIPVGAIDKAVEQHPRYVRGRRRVRDLVERLREVLDDDHDPDLAELEEHVRQAMLDASEAGWRLGLLMSRAATGRSE